MNNDIFQLAVTGINHATSTISEREVFQINKKEIRTALRYFKSRSDVGGAVIVSTCNRLEFYVTLKRDVNPFPVVCDFYSEKGIATINEKRDIFYTCRGIDAARHLFKVISGLDSMLIGEYQVQGQVKDAYSLACSEKTCDKILHKLFHMAFHTGKEVRTKTKIGSGNQSLSGIAFNIIKEKVDPADAITIIGVNQNTKIIAEKSIRAGYSHLIFANRTLHEAEKLAGMFGGRAIGLDRIGEAVEESTCVFSCTGAPGYVVASKTINSAYACNRLPKLVIDMAIPHDIETDGIEGGIEIIDLDGLRNHLDRQAEDISLDIPDALQIISGEANLFEAWSRTLNNEDVYLLEEKVEAIRLQLLNETKPNISKYELRLLDQFSRSLVHRMESVINESVRTNSAVSGTFKGVY